MPFNKKKFGAGEIEIHGMKFETYRVIYCERFFIVNIMNWIHLNIPCKYKAVDAFTRVI